MSPSRDSARSLRQDIEKSARLLDLHMGDLETSETSAQATLALYRALNAAHAIADRLEAFAAPHLPQIASPGADTERAPPPVESEQQKP
jgi:hypothetical protein